MHDSLLVVCFAISGDAYFSSACLCCVFCRCSEWVVNHHRDSMASHIGHSDMLAYFAVAEGESIGRVKYTMLEKMLQPCGPPPARTEVP